MRVIDKLEVIQRFIPVNNTYILSIRYGVWKLRKSGAKRALRSFQDKSEALRYSKSYARGKKGKLVVFNKKIEVIFHKDYGVL